MIKKAILLLKSKTKVIKNIYWSFLGSALSTGVLQLCVFPLLAKQYSEENYGSIIFSIGIVNVIMLTIGNALGDIRITRDSKYVDKNISGDFNIIISVGVLLSGTVTALIFCIFGEVLHTSSVWIKITLPLVTMFGTLSSYLLSYFRLRLQFKEGVIMNLIMSVGYVVGIFICMFIQVWAVPFLTAYLFADVYLIYKTRIYQEGYSKTVLCKGTIAEYFSLSLSYLIKSGMTYVDRFVITPMLGAASLSIYTVASTFGKSASIAIQPMANVALGYYSQRDFKMTPKKYWITNGVTFLFGLLFYLLTLVLSKPFIGIFYPSYMETAVQYIPIANIAVILTAVTAMIQPAILKYSRMLWQLVIQLSYGAVVLLLSLLLIPRIQMFGFCYAMIIANVLKLALMLLIGIFI